MDSATRAVAGKPNGAGFNPGTAMASATSAEAPSALDLLIKHAPDVKKPALGGLIDIED
ncbi:hypothetical protein D3C84_1021940 [compost metagenome]